MMIVEMVEVLLLSLLILVLLVFNKLLMLFMYFIYFEKINNSILVIFINLGCKNYFPLVIFVFNHANNKN